jgi:hypothetical protein
LGTSAFKIGNNTIRIDNSAHHSKYAIWIKRISVASESFYPMSAAAPASVAMVAVMDR